SILDIGASRGEALRPFIERKLASEYVAIEVSEPMRNEIHQQFGQHPAVKILDTDLRKFSETEYRLTHGCGAPSLILSVLTLMFTPIQYRPTLIGQMYNLLKPGGAFILVEKVI